MIFVTVGHQTPFDRLVKAVDEWAGATGRTDIFAQVGRTAYRPRHFEAVEFLSPQEFDRRMREAQAIVAHAGTGTIIAALQLGKPLLVLPRLSALGETRNDHQIPTARHFESNGHVLAADSEKSVASRMPMLESFRPASRIGSHASPELIAALRQFIFSESAPSGR